MDRHPSEVLLDRICEERGDEAVEVIAKQFGLTNDEMEVMLADESGVYDEHSAVFAYYGLLDTWWKEAMHA